MASTIDCLYCFECLVAKLEKRQGLSHESIESLWAEHNNTEGRNFQKSDSESSFESPLEKRRGIVDGESAHSLSQDLTRMPLSSIPTAIPEAQLSSCSSPNESSPSSVQSSPSLLATESSGSTNISSSSSSRSQITSTHVDGYRPSLGKTPMFVTWNIHNRSGKQLRGCIGTFEPQDLRKGLRTYALTSAFEDVRFQPISSRELPTLECGVTLLTDFETVSSPLDWEIGKHGIKISFSHNSRRFGSTYLPEVAKEQGWTKSETLISLMRKAGWSGRADDWTRVDNLSVIRYQGHQATLSYEKFKVWRSSVSKSPTTFRS